MKNGGPFESIHIKIHASTNTGDSIRNASVESKISRDLLMCGLYRINLGKYFMDRFNYSLHIVIGHLGIDGQTNCPAVAIQGNRKILRLKIVAVTPVWMKMQWDKMHAGADSALGHFFDKFIPGDFDVFQI